jgi:hypothetical protein
VKTKKTLHNPKDQNPTCQKEAFAINYGHKQFPWLSKADIMKAIELKRPDMDYVLKYLDHKGVKGKSSESHDY